MRPVITAFDRSPDRGQGLARDMPVRWALEEVGQPYDVRLRSFEELKQAEHRAIQPFGQIPTYEEDGLALFESGAIVLHIGERFGGLLPTDLEGRARAIAWMFAAIGTLESPIFERSLAMIFDRDKPWFETRLPTLDANVRRRLDDLSARLGAAEWLERDFTGGDLLVISVLRRLKSSGLLDDNPNLSAYVERGEARPAFRRAFEAQRAVFEASQG